MAATSAARIAANRRNAQQSTGPRTTEGKARSRANALKHGLTGAGIALPTEDEALVQRRFTGLQADLGAADLPTLLLVQQMALMSVRIDRAARQETAALAMRIRHAVTEHDVRRLAEVDRLFGTIETAPADHRRQLLTDPDGVDKLAAALRSARTQLATGAFRSWGPITRKKFEALFGSAEDFLPVTRVDALVMAWLDNNFRFLDPAELATLPDRAARRPWALKELLGLIDAELAHLAATRARLDLAGLAQDRAEAGQRALFDPGADATAARKYEAAARRGFFRALRDLRELAAEPPITADHVGLATGAAELSPAAGPLVEPARADLDPDESPFVAAATDAPVDHFVANEPILDRLDDHEAPPTSSPIPPEPPQSPTKAASLDRAIGQNEPNLIPPTSPDRSTPPGTKRSADPPAPGRNHAKPDLLDRNLPLREPLLTGRRLAQRPVANANPRKLPSGKDSVASVPAPRVRHRQAPEPGEERHRGTAAASL